MNGWLVGVILNVPGGVVVGIIDICMYTLR